MRGLRRERWKPLSSWRQTYGRLRDLAQRAGPRKKLYDPVLPTIFLKWAKDNEIAVPAELCEKVYRLKWEAADWKKNYGELQARYDQHIADWRKLAEQQMASIKSLREKLSELEKELSELKAAPTVSEATKSQSPIERQNMLKVIYAMALAGYKYKPNEKRSPIVAEIVSDIALQGTPVSDDTVRRI